MSTCCYEIRNRLSGLVSYLLKALIFKHCRDNFGCNQPFEYARLWMIRVEACDARNGTGAEFDLCACEFGDDFAHTGVMPDEENIVIFMIVLYELACFFGCDI